MHDGSKPYEGVLQTVQELKNAGKKMIILSNSSKQRSNSEKMLVKRECILAAVFHTNTSMINAVCSHHEYSALQSPT